VRTISNFQDEAVGSKSARGLVKPLPEDDPRDLVGLAADMRMLRNGLEAWKGEMERFRKRVDGEGDFVTGKGMRMLDAGEYLERTVDEYSSMVRMCEGMLEQVSMTFQMVRFLGVFFPL
jgi:hypothetical protein